MNKALEMEHEIIRGTELPAYYKSDSWIRTKAKVVQLQDEIGFKKIGNEIKQKLPGLECNEIRENQDVSLDVWKTYLNYLEILKEKTLVIRQFIKSEFTEEELLLSQFLLQDNKGLNYEKKKKVNRHIPIDEPHSKVIQVIRSEKIKKDYL